ncbi:MAG: hypothetical protein QOE84_2542 [Actinomycetota bacterium]|nr:hypothetical protein [Actinomycetota bacterium]
MPPRKHRRAVGPPGAPPPADEPRLDEPERVEQPDDDERFHAERPPHHDQER